MIAKDEAEFTQKANSWIDWVYERQAPKLTPFLTPRERNLLEGLANYAGVAIEYFGGFVGASRVRGILYLQDAPSLEDFQIAAFTIEYPRKFVRLEHRQILGTLMSLQVDRSRIGDILLDEEGNGYVVFSKEMAPYFQEHFTQIGSTSIKLRETDITTLQWEEKLEEFQIMVASLRLDVVVSAILNLSRAQSAEYFKLGYVQLNHQQELNHSRTCKVGDLLSLRKYGRCKILEQVRVTKNQKLVLRVGKVV